MKIIPLTIWLFLGFLGIVVSQCQFDTKCFRFSIGCTLTNANPYDRRSPMSCTECLNRCLQQQKGPAPYFCRAAVYDARYQTCDLFAVNAMMPPYRLSKMYGRCYFQPTGCCSARTPAPPPPPPPIKGPAESCPSGQTAKLIAIKDYEYPGISGMTIPANGPDACAQLCLKNQLPLSMNCMAAQYGPGTQCIVSANPGSNVEAIVQPSPGATYYQKLCFPNGNVINCPDVFEEDPQKILVGQNRQSVDAVSMQDCMQKCLDSQKLYGFVCKSGMYFYQETQLTCILNTESKSTKPDLFTDAQNDKVTYFEPGCNGGQQLAIVSAKAKDMKTSDLVKDTPITGEWTLWSPCTTSDKQYRFMPCAKSDPRQCDKQEKPCQDGDPNQNVGGDEAFFKEIKHQQADGAIKDGNATKNFTPCKALFRNGQKNCTFGLQSVDGEMAYCHEPVDPECIAQS